MVTQNFAALSTRWPELYQHAVQAEGYVYQDPPAASIKLRCFAERLVGIVYREWQLTGEVSPVFFERLKNPAFADVAGPVVLSKLHGIRVVGNKAAHGEAVDASTALALLGEAYLLGQWFYKTLSGDTQSSYPPFTAPLKASEAPSAVVEEAEPFAESKRELSELEAAEQAAFEQQASSPSTTDPVDLSEIKAASIRANSSIDFASTGTRLDVQIDDVFAGYSLTGGQAELVKRLGQFLTSNTESVFLLKGYAGTGKTFITKGLTEYFRAIGRNYVLAAPTGKASKVIASKTQSEAYTLHKTIYSFDDLAEYRDQDTDGSETFKFYADLAPNLMSADTVYIVDEASMVADIYQEAEFIRFGSGYLLTDFLKFVNLDHNDHSKKVIFIGDDAQLPPVGMNFSPALDAEYLRRHHHARTTGFELSEVVRQKAESGVIANALPLRQALEAKVFNRLTMNLDYPDVEKVAHSAMLERYLESCNYKNNGKSIVIAHSNADVAEYNKTIRGHFFPGCEQVVRGDKVMAIANNSAYGFFISNGDFGQVREVLSGVEQRVVQLRRKNADTQAIEEVTITLLFRDVVVAFRDLAGNVHEFETKIVEDLLYSKEPALSSDQNKALYVDFCIRHPGLKAGTKAFKDTLKADRYFNALRLKFGYAITCHKAQGSEWNHVFVKCKSHQSQLTADYFRWLYTAITRSSEHLYLLDPPNIQPWSGIEIVANPALAVLTAQQPQSVATVSVVPAAENDSAQVPDDFGIPEGAPLLRSLFFEVQKLIAGRGVSIEDIHHNQYQEVYFLRSGAEVARVDISYNGKNKITGVQAPMLTELGSELTTWLAVLKGVPLLAATGASVAGNEFAKPFLNDFHATILGLCETVGIAIVKVTEQQWSQRYSFSRGSEVAVYDLWYNGKDRFTKCQAVITACSPGTLTAEVGQLITQGMQA